MPLLNLLVLRQSLQTPLIALLGSLHDGLAFAA